MTEKEIVKALRCCTNQKICPDCQRVRNSEKGDRHA